MSSFDRNVSTGLKKEVLIAIQARSNSTRFPGKIYQKIGERRVLDMVIDRAFSTAKHLNMHATRANVNCSVAVLHPEHDTELVDAFGDTGPLFIGGPEDDVLTRYLIAAEAMSARYIVRITSDCPLMLDFVIAKHISTAVFYSYDYVNNVDERCRFVADGFDCEVLSMKALRWLDENATSKSDREHVTTLIRSQMPKALTKAFIAFKQDTFSGLLGTKMSVDTLEDLEKCRAYHHEYEHKRKLADRLYGDRNVYDL